MKASELIVLLSDVVRANGDQDVAFCDPNNPDTWYCAKDVSTSADEIHVELEELA